MKGKIKMTKKVKKNSIVNFVGFKFSGENVRVTDKDGTVWFIAKDVCSVLGLRNVSQACVRLHDMEKGIILSDTHGGPQKTLIISESGIYKLIMTSTKKDAIKFQNWIAEDIIPQVRKTGTYISKDVSPLDILQQQVDILKDHDARLSNVENRLTNFDKQLLANSKNCFPEYSQNRKELNCRQKLYKLVKIYSIKYNADPKTAYSTLYIHYSATNDVNINDLARKNKMSKINYIDSIGKMEELYTLAKEMFV